MNLVKIERILKEPGEDDLEGPDDFIVIIPMGGRDLHEHISESKLLNPRLDLAGWVIKRLLKCEIRENEVRNGWRGGGSGGLFRIAVRRTT
jgi:hypothetical protein